MLQTSSCYGETRCIESAQYKGKLTYDDIECDNTWINGFLTVIVLGCVLQIPFHVVQMYLTVKYRETSNINRTKSQKI